MIRRRLRPLLRPVRRELERAFADEHPQGDVAASFAVGVFVAALPTLGAGLVVFYLLIRFVDRVSAVAMFASLLVLNPVVKWGFYAGSFWLGSLLLGPAPGGAVPELSLSAGSDVLVRLLVGNVVIAAVCAVLAYGLALHVITALRARDLHPLETLVDDGLE